MSDELNGELGGDWNLYRNAGTVAAESLVLMPRVSDVELDLDKLMADRSTRESKWDKEKGARFQTKLTFTYRYKNGDATYLALLDSYRKRKPIGFAVADMEITEANVFGVKHIYMEVKKLPLPQQLRSGVDIPVECVLTPYDEGNGEQDPEFLGAE